jgi:hypothetical protein
VGVNETFDYHHRGIYPFSSSGREKTPNVVMFSLHRSYRVLCKLAVHRANKAEDHIGRALEMECRDPG